MVFQHPRLTVIEDIVCLPDGYETDYILFKQTPGSVTVLAVQDSKILVEREYSYPMNRVLYQFPGGGVKKGETPHRAAERELIEETGYKAHKLKRIGWFYPDNRRSASKMYVYLATDLHEVPKKGGDKEEEIKTEWISFGQLNQRIKAGRIVNYAMLAAWAFFRQTEF